jgi:hypothetical protein
MIHKPGELFAGCRWDGNLFYTPRKLKSIRITGQKPPFMLPVTYDTVCNL